MKYQSHLTFAVPVMLALTLAGCMKEGGHGHSHDGAAPANAAVVATVANAAPATSTTPASDSGIRSDEVRVTLQPNQGTEIKMAMKKGEKIDYSWQTEGGPVNHDTHGEPPGDGKTVHRYSKGVAVAQNNGTLVAAFDGEHGWFWRNRNDREVTITLKVSGQYQSIAQKK
ncbi:transmembrane anchor protein [Massilia sp. NP310]|jgi:hypothetical protein|uniref:transmembrane anchor protein n=1 Tax=Massilia sp. NP310 TaxID=2861282 RepID=UPI001C625906|nr:transmembrane anchor protein [Massilia sp. NP310]QYG02796.1 transmembrane anchor protein [Massilia sp. NP310]